MAKQTIRGRLIEALRNRGETVVMTARTTKYVVMTRRSGGFYFEDPPEAGMVFDAAAERWVRPDNEGATTDPETEATNGTDDTAAPEAIPDDAPAPEPTTTGTDQATTVKVRRTMFPDPDAVPHCLENLLLRAAALKGLCDALIAAGLTTVTAMDAAGWVDYTIANSHHKGNDNRDHRPEAGPHHHHPAGHAPRWTSLYRVSHCTVSTTPSTMRPAPRGAGFTLAHQEVTAIRIPQTQVVQPAGRRLLGWRSSSISFLHALPH